MDFGTFADLLREANRSARAGVDTGLTLGKGMVMEPIAGIAGLGELIRSGDLDRAVDRIERVRGLGGGPRSAEGAELTGKIGAGIERVIEPLKRGTDAVGAVSPAAGAALAGLGAVVDPTKLGKGASRMERAAALMREHGGQAVIPGIEPRTRVELADQAARDATRAHTEAVQRVDDEPDFRNLPELEALEGEARAANNAAAERLMVERQNSLGRERLAAIEDMRASRADVTDPAEALNLERDIYRAKLAGPVADLGDDLGVMLHDPRVIGSYELPSVRRERFSDVAELPPEARDALIARRDMIQAQRQRVQDADAINEFVNPEPPEIRQPDWARVREYPTDPYTGRPIYGETHDPMAGERSGDDYVAWWDRAVPRPELPPLGPARPNPLRSVRAFTDEIGSQPGAFELGGELPEGLNTLQDFADEFAKRSGRGPIKASGERRTWGEDSADPDYDSDEPYKIEVEKTHGPGEVMRDRYGEYIQEPKLHEFGDWPMYDEFGDVKMVPAHGPVREGEDPLKVKRVAEGGEPVREGGRYGGQEKYTFVKSEGGEPMRDERGNIKYEEVENPDYRSAEEIETFSGSLRRDTENGGSEGVDVSRGVTGAMNAGRSGREMYQALLAYASKHGLKMPANSTLTEVNQYRLLSNVLANALRTGDNPRNVTHTVAGSRPEAQGYAPAEEVFRALAGETDERLARQKRNPDALRFTPEGFTLEGEPVTLKQIADQIGDLSPQYASQAGRKAGAGPKMLAKNALYKWLERATPEEAADLAKTWDKRNLGKIFGVGGAAVLADQMRDDQRAGSE